MSKLGLTLLEVRDLIGGGEIHGDERFLCVSVASLEKAGPDQLSFVSRPANAARAGQSAAGALIVAERIADGAANQLVVEHPFIAMIRLLRKIARDKRAEPSGVHPTAVVDAGVHLGKDVTIGAGAVLRTGASIGDRTQIYANVYVGHRSTIGADCVIQPNAVVMEDVTLGDRVLIHGCTVVGGDGYGYVQHEGKHVKIPQVGRIEIGDDVEIGAAATIDRAALDATVIGRGSKLGDLTHVAHNCIVGEDVLILPIAVIAGSATVGDGAVMGPRSGLMNGKHLGAGAMLGAEALAYKDVPPGAVMWGKPARPKNQQLRIEAALGSLPEMQKELRAIKQQLDRSAAAKRDKD